MKVNARSWQPPAGFAPASLAGLRTDPRSLKGRHAISYFRFSSSPQESGDTIRRQEATLRYIARHFGLIIDQKLIDRAKSGSRGQNRLRGQLGDLLKAVHAGTVPRGTVLIVESFSRLSREGTLDVFSSILKPLISDAGLIIVDGKLRIWDEAAINSHEVHALIGEIIAAREYAEGLSFYAQSAHERRRERFAKDAIVLGDGWTEGPLTNSLPPAWIVRETMPDRRARYRLHPVCTAVVRLIFDLCVAGNSAIQIAAYLNSHGHPTFDAGKRTADEWRATRVSMILRSEMVCGWYQSFKRNGSSRVAIGERVRLYPAAIDDATWYAVREALAVRRSGLRGRRGKTFPNLFTGKLVCKTCKKPMRVVVSNSKDLGENGMPRRRYYQCASYHDARGCSDDDRYDANHWEPRLLHLLSTSFQPVRRKSDATTRKKIGQLKRDVADRDTAIAALRPKIGSSATRMRDYDVLTDERDALLKVIAQLEAKQAVEDSPDDRHAELEAFLRDMMIPALQGDVDVRERLRSLLSRIDFKVISHRQGAMRIIYGTHDLLLCPVPDDHVLAIYLPDVGEPTVLATPYRRRG
jgi:hypothetical protein